MHEFQKAATSFRKYDTEKIHTSEFTLCPVKKLLAVGNFTELYVGYNMRAGKKDEKGLVCSQDH